MSTYDSNMASEFLVMSNLYRIGLSPILTLGNKKEIDILIYKNNIVFSLDVKGLKGTTNWPIGSSEKLQQLQNINNHFFVFVSYKNKFANMSFIPEIYVVPVRKAIELAAEWRGQNQYVILYKTMKERRDEFLNKWSCFL